MLANSNYDSSWILSLNWKWKGLDIIINQCLQYTKNCKKITYVLEWNFCQCLSGPNIGPIIDRLIAIRIVFLSEHFDLHLCDINKEKLVTNICIVNTVLVWYVASSKKICI